MSLASLLLTESFIHDDLLWLTTVFFLLFPDKNKIKQDMKLWILSSSGPGLSLNSLSSLSTQRGHWDIRVCNWCATQQTTYLSRISQWINIREEECEDHDTWHTPSLSLRARGWWRQSSGEGGCRGRARPGSPGWAAPTQDASTEARVCRGQETGGHPTPNNHSNRDLEHAIFCWVALRL